MTTRTNITKEFTAGNVSAGRAYVKAYVEFLHLVERLYDAATTAPHGHVEKTESTGTKR